MTLNAFSVLVLLCTALLSIGACLAVAVQGF